jgi:hypothetical protein
VAVFVGMRALFAIVLFTLPAVAQPGKPAVLTGTAIAPAPDLERRSDAPADHAGDPGILIVPPPIADARPWPRGMVIGPLDLGDRMPNLAVRLWTATGHPASAPTRLSRVRGIRRRRISNTCARRSGCCSLRY